MFLALDTVTHFCSVALAERNGKLLAAFHEPQTRGHAETIVPLIEKAFEKGKTKPSSLEGIVVTAGPGTFAGVRIGLSAARALAFATGAKVLALTSFEALMGLARLRHGTNLPPLVLAAVPGRGDENAAELFSQPNPTRPPWTSLHRPKTLATGEAAAWLAGKPALVVGPAADRLVREIPSAAIAAESAWPRAEDLLRLMDFFPKGRWGKRATPFYLRPPDARPSVLIPHG